MNKTNFSIVIAVVIIAGFFFVVGRETQPNIASAQDATTTEVSTITTLNSGPSNTVPQITAPQITVSPENSVPRIHSANSVRPLNFSGKHFLDNWERFTAKAELTEAEELRVLDILADMQERLILINKKTQREFNALPDNKASDEALWLSIRHVGEISISAVQRKMGEFLTPKQVESFRKTYITITDFPELGGSIREFMGLTSKSSIPEIIIETARSKKHKILRVKKPKLKSE